MLIAEVLSASDADNDAISFTYAWSVNGNVVQTTTTTSLTNALDLSQTGLGDRGDAISVSITPFDANDTGDTVTLYASVVNSAPTVGSVTFDLTSPGTNDVVTATVHDIADADGDAIVSIFHWYLNSNYLTWTSSETGVGTIDLSESGFGDKGDVVSVVVSPFDSIESGDTVTTSATVVNSVPTLTECTYYASSANTATVFDILGNSPDPDDDPLDIIVMEGPDHGTLTDNLDGTMSFTPDSPGWTGSDSFTVKVNDGTSDSNTVTMNVVIANPSPIANSDYVEIENSSTTTITLSGQSGTGNALTYLITSLPSRGSLFDGTYEITGSDLVSGPYVVTNSEHQVIFVPDSNKFGRDEFSFRVNNGDSDSEIQSISIMSVPAGDAPSIDPNVSIDVPDVGVTVTDIDLMSKVTYTGSGDVEITITQPEYGSLSYNSTTGKYDYVADATYTGWTTFTFEASDGVNSTIGSGTFFVQTPIPGTTVIPVAHRNAIRSTLDLDLTFGPRGTALPQNAGQYVRFRNDLAGVVAGVANNNIVGTNGSFMKSTITTITPLFGALSTTTMTANETAASGALTGIAVSVTTRLDVQWRVIAVGPGGIRTIRTQLALVMEVSYTTGGVSYSGEITTIPSSTYDFRIDLNARSQ